MTVRKIRQDSDLLRIGIFYDGVFFHHISNYYRYENSRMQRISISGLHDFIRVHAAECMGVDLSFSHIVDAHFFRGRHSAQQTHAREKLFADRLFDDILMNENITPHYRPIIGGSDGAIATWLSLEAYELASYGRYDLVVLIAGDSDFVPLVSKLNALGVRVMLLGWDFKYTDGGGTQHQTTTSARLINEVSFPIAMHEVMEDVNDDDPLLKQLFIETAATSRHEAFDPRKPQADVPPPPIPPPGTALRGAICTVKDGFGFISCQEYPNNVFFHFSAVLGCDFDDLKEGDCVTFFVEKREKGPIAKDVTLANPDSGSAVQGLSAETAASEE